jgi:hypothetical protein
MLIIQTGHLKQKDGATMTPVQLQYRSYLASSTSTAAATTTTPPTAGTGEGRLCGYGFSYLQ